MNKLSILFIAIIFGGLSATAQDYGSTLDRDLTITKEGKIELPDVNRNYEKITYDVPKAEVNPQEYDFVEVPGQVAKLDMKVKIRTLNPDALTKLYGNYVKAGFGNYVTPYFEGYFNSKRSDKNLYGVNIKHLSSAKGPVEYARNSINQVGGYGKYFLSNNATLKAEASYTRQRFNYYGFDQDLENIDEDTLKLVYNIFKAGIGIQNSIPASGIDYDLGLKYYNLGNSNSSENEVLLNYSGSYWFDKEKDIDVTGTYSFSSRKFEEAYNRHFFQIRPSISLSKSEYQVSGGLTIAYTSDSTLSSKFHLYPYIKGKYYLIPDQVTVFAGIGGEMEKNTLRTFAAQNPWLLDGVLLSNTNRTFELYGGVEGNTLEKLTYKVKLSYQTYKNLPFFVNDISDTSDFALVYDSGNSSLLNLYGGITYEWSDKVKFGIDLNYYGYNLSKVEEPWHRPVFDLAFLTTMNLYKKIYFDVDIFYLSGIKAFKPLNGETEKLDNILDLNLKLDYRFSNSFSVFVQLNNLLGKKYQRYLYYPVKGANVLAGVTYTF